jgi:hypothetical protein
MYKVNSFIETGRDNVEPRGYKHEPERKNIAAL